MESQQKKQLEELLTRIISPEELALRARRFLVESIKMYLNHDDSNGFVDKEWLSDGHYWITELCEVLDPQLTEKPVMERKQ